MAWLRADQLTPSGALAGVIAAAPRLLGLNVVVIEPTGTTVQTNGASLAPALYVLRVAENRYLPTVPWSPIADPATRPWTGDAPDHELGQAHQAGPSLSGAPAPSEPDGSPEADAEPEAPISVGS